MAKRTRAPARGGRTTQTTRRSRKPAEKTANKTAEKPKRKTTQKSEFAQTRHASLSRRWSYTPELLSYVRQRFEQIVACLRASATEGEIVKALEQVWGRHRPRF